MTRRAVGNRGGTSLQGGVLKLCDEFEERALLARRKGGVHHVTFPSVHRWEQLVDDGLGPRG